MKKGKVNSSLFIVFEGLDGSGKSTQTKLLAKELRKAGFSAAKIDFPQYGKKSAGMIEEYLNGKYGSSRQVGSYRASVFYACDRYDASFKIRKFLGQGKIVIADRYVSSNIGHQGGKIRDKKKRLEYFNWLYNLEYDLFGIPKPDIIFILKNTPELSYKLSPRISDKIKARKRLGYLGNRKRDIHERDLKHLRETMESYLLAARIFPREYNVIECVKNKKMLNPEIIHKIIWTKVSKRLR
ncbi:thymidylate kinase [Patescibacteria group bacterium]|nr:thymidylate kinase [Patescibacteria group bacterium]